MRIRSVLGASGGLVWALSTDHHSFNAINVVGYPLAGFAIGLVGGAATYVVHQAINRYQSVIPHAQRVGIYCHLPVVSHERRTVDPDTGFARAG